MKNKNYKFCLILCTVPDKNSAYNISTILLKKKLTACINILENITSLYVWKNKIKKQKELQLIIKSCIKLEDNVFIQIKKNHPYKIPEILTIPIENGDINYIMWLKQNLYFIKN